MNDNDALTNSTFDQDGAIDQISPDESLGGGDFAPDVGTGGGGRRISMGSLVIVIIVVVSAGALFSMRTLAKVSAAVGNSEVEKVIDRMIAHLGENTTTTAGGGSVASRDSMRQALRERTVIDVLSDDYAEIRVPLSNVQFNPFVMFGEMSKVKPDVVVPTGDLEGKYNREREERKQLIQSTGESLRLTSVMLGEPRMAIVNDKLLREGQTVRVDPAGIEFTVESISLEAVTMISADEYYQLSVPILLFVKRN